MNANELADELIDVASVAKPTDDGVTYGLAGYCIKAATMLRQLQAENEPVAWMRTNKQWRKEVSWVKKEGFEIPLYTHPSKDLTDEEIITIAEECDLYHFKYVNFARAILRKAQEK